MNVMNRKEELLHNLTLLLEKLTEEEADEVQGIMIKCIKEIYDRKKW